MYSNNEKITQFAYCIRKLPLSYYCWWQQNVRILSIIIVITIDGFIDR